MSKVAETCDKELIGTFKNEIDGDYLIRVTNEVMEDGRFKVLVERGCFPCGYELVSEQYAYKIVVVYNVAMIFYYDTLVLNNDEEKIKARYSDENYENELIAKVIDQLVLSSLIKSTEVAEKATYYPIMYAMFALVNYMYYEQLLVYIDEHPNYQNDAIIDFRVVAMKQLFLTTRTALLQLVVGDYTGVRSSIRILIEDYFIYRVLHNSEKGIKEYVWFTDEQKNHDLTNRYSKKFFNTIPKGKNISIVKYVDYGWLRAFDKNPKTDEIYTFKDLVNHCSDMTDDEKKDWIDTFNNFSKHSHGEVLNASSPEIEILDNASYIDNLLIKISTLYEKDFVTTAAWQGIDLISNLISKDSELHGIFSESKRFITDKQKVQNSEKKTKNR